MFKSISLVLACVSILFSFSLGFTQGLFFSHPITEQFHIGVDTLRCDDDGHGYWEASRDGGSRLHKGIDLVQAVGNNIYAPFEGTYVRKMSASNLPGVEIQGTGAFENFKLQLLYVEPTLELNTPVQAGDVVGIMQDLKTSLTYADNMFMINHTHVQLRMSADNSLIDPTGFYDGESVSIDNGNCPAN